MAHKIQSVGGGYLRGEFSIIKICHLQFKYLVYMDKDQLTSTCLNVQIRNYHRHILASCFSEFFKINLLSLLSPTALWQKNSLKLNTSYLNDWTRQVPRFILSSTFPYLQYIWYTWKNNVSVQSPSVEQFSIYTYTVYSALILLSIDPLVMNICIALR